jgi:hypothetical protein
VYTQFFNFNALAWTAELNLWTSMIPTGRVTNVISSSEIIGTVGTQQPSDQSTTISMPPTLLIVTMGLAGLFRIGPQCP